MHMKILRIAVPTPLRQYFDYLPLENAAEQACAVGVRVRVPFQRRELIGIVMGHTLTADVAPERLKTVLEVLDTEPVLSGDVLQLCLWAADYYHDAIGEIVANALPVLLRQGKPCQPGRTKKRIEEIPAFDPALQLNLNPEQQVAVAQVQAALDVFQVFLLDGVTGSGKTEVYLQVIQAVLQAGKQVLVLVPEIGLTPQTIQRFRARFATSVLALHSGLTERERLNAWIAAKSGQAQIIIGTRSAVFTPLPHLGLIIVDEEHDLSFKQQDGFRYHARDMAIMRAHLNKIPIVLGSATPALETMFNAQQGKFRYVCLPHRAGNALLPTFHVVDIRNQTLEQGLSPTLLQMMQEHLARDEQVMLFLNRRGYAPVLLCHACGWMVDCKRCDMRMTYHKSTARLHCHHCEMQKKIPVVCEACGEKTLQAVGVGTERLEDVLKKYFPKHSIARIDRDNTQRKGSMEKLLTNIQAGLHHILIGTQMLAKGHHFPNVTLVAIVDADGGFFSSDFRAFERMGQLLLQVAGRAGRVNKPGKVVMQTHHPDHPLLFQLFNDRYQQFASTLLQERAAACLPPYAHIALVRAEAFEDKHVLAFLTEAKTLMQAAGFSLQILGPVPAPMPRRAGRYRAQLLLQAKQRAHLQQFLKQVLPDIEKIPSKHRVRWSLDVDPVEMF